MNTIAPYEVGVVAVDLEPMVRFYTEVLGMTVYSDVSVPADLGERTGLSPRGYRVVRLDTKNGQRLKIAQAPDTVAAGAAQTFPMRTGGNFYITFIVDDLASTRDRLQGSVAQVCSPAIVEVRPGVSLFLARDPEANYLEFVEYADVQGYLGTGSAEGRG